MTLIGALAPVCTTCREAIGYGDEPFPDRLFPRTPRRA
jgi:hypothetical protein